MKPQIICDGKCNNCVLKQRTIGPGNMTYEESEKAGKLVKFSICAPLRDIGLIDVPNAPPFDPSESHSTIGLTNADLEALVTHH